MKVFLLSVVAGLSVLAPSAQAQTPDSRKPNVLFISIDDLRPEIGAFGAPGARTPNLDSLAARGTIFTRAYCQQAVCAPSRASILTGRRPDSSRVFNSRSHFRQTLPDAVTLPQLFKNNGYFTQSFGKVFHPGVDDAPSWGAPSFAQNYPSRERSLVDFSPAQIVASGLGPNPVIAEPTGEIVRKKDNPTKNEEAGSKPTSWAALDVSDDALSDGQIALEAGKTLEKVAQNPNQPFFLALGFYKPHLPFVAPKKYFDLHPASQIQLPAHPNLPQDVPKLALTNSSELRDYGDIPQGQEPIGDAKTRELIRAYRASVSYTDAQVGRVLADLDRLKLRDNTVIVVWSDHGWHLGDNGFWGKQGNFEITTRTPLLFARPGQKTAQKSDALVELLDIYPTVADLADVAKPAEIEGQSLLPILDNPKAAGKGFALSQYPRSFKGGQSMGYSLRTPRYRLTQWLDAESQSVLAQELYDLQIDPDGDRNLAALTENAPVLKELQTQLKQHFLALQSVEPLPYARRPNQK